MMQALCTGERFLCMIKKMESIIEIHSVFGHAINLIVQDDLYTVVDQTVGMSTSCMKIGPSERLFSQQIDRKAKASVETDKRLLKIGELLIDWGQGGVYRCPTKETAFDDLIKQPQGAINCMKSELEIQMRKKKQSMGSPFLFASRDIFSLLRSDQRDEEIQQQADILVKNLLGVGMGLTPSGDDFLVGILLVLGEFSDFKKIRMEISNSILRHLKDTTSISGAMLKNAIELEYFEYYSNLLLNLRSLERENIVQAVRKIASIGATSGCDMLMGVYSTLQQIGR